jgi:hypothetical protein
VRHVSDVAQSGIKIFHEHETSRLDIVCDIPIWNLNCSKLPDLNKIICFILIFYLQTSRSAKNMIFQLSAVIKKRIITTLPKLNASD